MFRISSGAKVREAWKTFQKIPTEKRANLENPEKFCKTNIYTPPLGGKKRKRFGWPPKKSFVGYVRKPFSKHMWRPEMR